MPIFEYLCDDCGTKFEKLIRRAEDSSGVACPSCGDNHLTEQLSTFAAHANGASANKSSSARKSSNDAMPSCGSGMCGMPGMCGRN
jgi:putative FmdB family regulatory protein